MASLRAAPVQRIEHRNAVGTAHHRLVVERERPGAQQRRGDRYRRIPGIPVAAFPGEQPNGVTGAPDLQAIAVVLDFVDSVSAGRRLGARVGMQGGNTHRNAAWDQKYKSTLAMFRAPA